MTSSAAGTGVSSPPDMFYRLNPHRDIREKSTSMFAAADALDLRLITGQQWGDDYFVAPADPEHRQLVEELLHEEGVFFERVQELPPHLRGYL